VLAELIQPRTYLEVGSRRGWSLAQVFAACPTVAAHVFELWQAGYGGTAQGSPYYIRDKIRQVIGPERDLNLTFVSGSSHDTLPEFFAQSTGEMTFDLITVDGDHSRLGAWWDLTDLFPHVAVGGALVFDDLEHPGDEDLGYPLPTSLYAREPMPAPLSSLLDVWQQMQIEYPNFWFLSSPVLKYRAGVAYRFA